MTSDPFFNSIAMNMVPTSVAANEKIPTVAYSPVRNVCTISRHSSTSRMLASTIKREMLVLYFIFCMIYEYLVSDSKIAFFLRLRRKNDYLCKLM